MKAIHRANSESTAAPAGATPNTKVEILFRIHDQYSNIGKPVGVTGLLSLLKKLIFSLRATYSLSAYPNKPVISVL